jgi:hypothetical protein
MNNSQRQNILNKIEQIEQLNLVDILSQAYPSEGDATKISIGNFNSAQLIHLIHKIMIQLKAELTEGLGIYLPQSQNFQNDFGDVNLERDLSHIYGWLSSADFNSVSSKVESLIYYQIINGFWDKTRIKIDSSIAETEKLLKELNVVQGKLNGFIDRNATLVQNIEKVTSDVAVFTHHCPTFLNYPQQYKGDALNEAFAVELFDMIESSNIDYWVYGHHHINISEFNIGNTKLLTNQLGYVQRYENTLFKTDKYIELK